MHQLNSGPNSSTITYYQRMSALQAMNWLVRRKIHQKVSAAKKKRSGTPKRAAHFNAFFPLITGFCRPIYVFKKSE